MILADKPPLARLEADLCRYVDSDAARTYIANHAKRFRETIGMIPIDHPMEVLDVGAFPPLTALLKRLTPHRYTMHAEPGTTPPGPERGWPIRIGGEELPVQRFDLEQERFPFPAESFDMVLCAEVVEHLGLDPFLMITEINRVLRPGGWLLLTTPNVVSTRATLKALLGFAPQFYSAFNLTHDRHNREYTPAEIVTMLACGGFRAEKVRTANVYYETTRFPMATRVGRLLVHGLTRLLDASDWRGDAIFALGKKIGPATERYPASFYDLADRPE